MLPRSERLTSAAFDRAFRHPQAEMVRHPRVHLKFAPSGEVGRVRAAFVVPKKQGGAVQRNEVRRRLRDRYRLHSLRAAYQLEGWDLIFLSTPGTAGATLAELDEALDNVINRAIKKVRKWSEPAGPEPPREDTSLQTPAVEAHSVMAARPITASALTLIRFYQRVVSPALPPACRFYPTCSRYTYEAIERYGVLQGGGLGLRRLCRCHPWHPGGFDPVPENLTMEVRLGAWWRKLCAWRSRPGLCGRKFG